MCFARPQCKNALSLKRSSQLSDGPDFHGGRLDLFLCGHTRTPPSDPTCFSITQSHTLS